MKEHENNGREYLFVKVPRGSCNYSVEDGLLWHEYHTSSYPSCIVLPTGRWLIMDLAGELSEQTLAQVAPRNEDGTYHNYDLPFSFETATESLESLLKSLGLEKETTLILLKL